MSIVLFIAASALGGALRYLMELRLPPVGTRAFPRATLIINITGSFILGCTIGLPQDQRVILGTALCGALTTFSGVALQLQRRFSAGSAKDALSYLVITVGACAFAAQLGMMLSDYLTN